MTMLDRWHDAVTACGHHTARPCGWCLWRAGYRGPRPPDRIRFTSPRRKRPVPAGSPAQLEIIMDTPETTDTRTPPADAWRVQFSTGRAPMLVPYSDDVRSARKAATVAAERVGTGGTYRVSVIREQYGLATGRAYTYGVSVIMEPRVVITDAGAAAELAGADDGGGE